MEIRQTSHNPYAESYQGQNTRRNEDVKYPPTSENRQAPARTAEEQRIEENRRIEEPSRAEEENTDYRNLQRVREENLSHQQQRVYAYNQNNTHNGQRAVSAYNDIAQRNDNQEVLNRVDVVV